MKPSPLSFFCVRVCKIQELLHRPNIIQPDVKPDVEFAQWIISDIEHHVWIHSFQWETWSKIQADSFISFKEKVEPYFSSHHEFSDTQMVFYQTNKSEGVTLRSRVGHSIGVLCSRRGLAHLLSLLILTKFTNLFYLTLKSRVLMTDSHWSLSVRRKYSH